MYRDSTDALIKLYKFSIEATAFKVFSKALQDHIDTRIRKVISDPKNDPQMIDSTLKLKRFVDTAVAALFSAPPKPIQATNDDDELMDIDAPSVDVLAHNRRLELEESVRAGFKSGLGSRQNAPAEWIGGFEVHVFVSNPRSQAPRRSHAQGPGVWHRGRVQHSPRRDHRAHRLHQGQGRVPRVLHYGSCEAHPAQQECK